MKSLERKSVLEEPAASIFRKKSKPCGRIVVLIYRSRKRDCKQANYHWLLLKEVGKKVLR
jgi:hypothetical protein